VGKAEKAPIGSTGKDEDFVDASDYLTTRVRSDEPSATGSTFQTSEPALPGGPWKVESCLETATDDCSPIVIESVKPSPTMASTSDVAHAELINIHGWPWAA
jgi:hypothetical protein